MRRRELGISISGLLVILVILIFAALLGFKLAPPYLEFSNIRKAVRTVAQEKQGASVADIRRAFELRQAVDDFTSVGPKDIEITKDGTEVVISAAYRREVPLFWNLGIYIDFQVSSKD